MVMEKEILLSKIRNLDDWLTQNGLAGYDPYDIKELPWVISLTRLGNTNLFFEVVREILFELFITFPLTARTVFNIRPLVNPKGVALLSSAYLDLYNIEQDSDLLVKSQNYLQWLQRNQSSGYPGISWGYPFNWQSGKLIPRFTPNGIVTTAAGDAFWKWYQFTGKQEYLEVCRQIAVFLASLPTNRRSDSQICFSYTPLYQNHVHNLNLFVAEYLIRIGKEVQNPHWIQLGEQAVNYTISYQRDDGSFDYNGPPEKPKNFSDNYHTGFVLRMLYSIWKLTKDEEVYRSLGKCYEHYISNFFEKSEIPKLLPTQKYRIDIHSCAESILCLSELSPEFPEGLEIAKKVANWTIKNLQDASGYFYYGFIKSRFFGVVFRSKIAYLRWGQAWMLKALVSLSTSVNNES